MYADDLIILSDSKGLQNQIDKMKNAFCTKWKLDINIAKTKIMIFNRGNRLNAQFYINNTQTENVKTFKYLGFTIPANNCPFTPTIDDLSIKGQPRHCCIK